MPVDPNNQDNPEYTSDAQEDNLEQSIMATSLNVQLQTFSGKNNQGKLWFKNFQCLCEHKNIAGES